MEDKLLIYNTLTRKKELFKPLHSPNVGMYVVLPFMATPTLAMPVLQLLSIRCSAI